MNLFLNPSDGRSCNAHSRTYLESLSCRISCAASWKTRRETSQHFPGRAVADARTASSDEAIRRRPSSPWTAWRPLRSSRPCPAPSARSVTNPGLASLSGSDPSPAFCARFCPAGRGGIKPVDVPVLFSQAPRELRSKPPLAALRRFRGRGPARRRTGTGAGMLSPDSRYASIDSRHASVT